MEDIVLEFRIRFESARMIFLQFQTRLFFLNDRVRFSLGLPVCFFFSFSVGRCVLHALDSEPQKTNEIPRIRHNIDDWPPCPGFGPKNGQKGTKTNPKTAYSKNHDGHINYLPTCFTKKKKTFDTRDSRVVPHRSTDRAQWCLTSQFGWDAVYPPWCDRMMGSMFL